MAVQKLAADAAMKVLGGVGGGGGLKLSGAKTSQSTRADATSGVGGIVINRDETSVEKLVLYGVIAGVVLYLMSRGKK